MIAEQLTDPVAYHGEGAYWHPSWGGLKWVDMLRGDILSLDPATGAIRRMPTGSSIAAMIRPRQGGGFVAATERSLTLWDASETLEWSTPPLWDADERFNEGAVDPAGRVLCGTITASRAPGAASMWRMGPDREAAPILHDLTISNGLGFTLDGTRAYYVDSPTRRVDVFDVTPSGDLTGRRPFVTFGDDVAGDPDGLCVDAGGGVWVAFYDGSCVRHFDADGRPQLVVETPGVTRVTSCTLGGPDLTTLYLTTSRENLPADEQPAAGSLFAAEVGVRGFPGTPAAL